MFSFKTIQHHLLKYQYQSEVDFCSTKPRRADNDWGNLSRDAAWGGLALDCMPHLVTGVSPILELWIQLERESLNALQMG